MYVHITCNHEKVPKTDWMLREKHKLYKTCLDAILHTLYIYLAFHVIDNVSALLMKCCEAMHK